MAGMVLVDEYATQIVDIAESNIMMHLQLPYSMTICPFMHGMTHMQCRISAVRLQRKLVTYLRICSVQIGRGQWIVMGIKSRYEFSVLNIIHSFVRHD